MILGSFALALSQLGDPRFRRVLWKGVGLAALALAALTLLVTTGAAWLLPDAVPLPFWGEVTWLDDAAGWALLPVSLALSVLLMTPVASAIIGLFLDEVADAVEARHWPRLPPVRPLPWPEALADSLRVLGLVAAANVAAFALYLALPPFAPLIFLAVNGFLLGREYAQLAATRRLGRDGARAFLKAHGGRLWLAGALMAVPLTIPLVNLLVPVLGAATFTHLVNRLARV